MNGQITRDRPQASRLRRLVAVLGVGCLLGQLVTTPSAWATPGPPGALEYWFDTWNVPGLWAGGARGGGITIAEIDTGVSGNIPQIAAKLLPGTDYVSGGDGHVDRDTGKSLGHGTGMASIMVADKAAGNVTGLAPDAKILPITLPLNPEQRTDNNDHLADAIIWSADHGAKIINMSLGGPRNPEQDVVPCQSEDQAAIDYALSKGLILVAASGNAGDKGSPVEDPGVCLGVLAVGAVDKANNVPVFSSRHPYLALTAPGVSVPYLSATGVVMSGIGTSQATAVTSAALALVWSKYPTRTSREIVSMVLSSLDHATGTRDPAYGYGVINPASAIAVGNPSAANPIYDAVQPFLDQDAAQATSEPAPPPAPTRSSPLGAVALGSEPSAWSATVLRALTVALVGLAGVIGLASSAWLLRRRRRGEGGAQGNALPDEMQYGLPSASDGLWQDVTVGGVLAAEKRTLFGRRKV